MGPVSAEVEIDVPRERAFETIGDLSRRLAFTDHFVSGFHLTRIDPVGIGAGARLLVTHNVRHFRSGAGVRVVRPRTLLEEARAWLAGLGR